VQVLIDEPEDLSHVMSKLNRLTAGNCPSNRFVTLFFCVLDSTSGELSYCNAGHNPPMLVRKDGSVELLSGGGTVLGILPEAKYEEMRCRMEVGDLLVIYSDGVTEATNPAQEEFEEDRLEAVLHEHKDDSAQAIVEAVNRAIAEWAAGSPPADDITLVVAKRTG
jgi:sigma-B regulation protein RsbU (phosphoserine phosphatase)